MTATQTLKWRKDQYGCLTLKFKKYGAPMRLIADSAVTCDGSEAYEWYAEELFGQYRRFVRYAYGCPMTFATLAEAKEDAEAWMRCPEAYTSVREG